VVTDNPHGLLVTGRLKPGVSLAVAQAELNVAAAQLSREDPDWRTLKLSGTPVLERVTGPQRPLLFLLLGAVSFVLLIACVNVANLLLARSAAREHEIAIRMALGARRGDIVRFVLAEALTISVVASLASVAIAYGGLRVLKPLTATLPRADELSVDARVLLCSLLLGFIAALLFGVFPALRSAQPAQAAGMGSRTNECRKCFTMASRRLTFASNPKWAVRTPIPDASGGLMMNEIASSMQDSRKLNDNANLPIAAACSSVTWATSSSSISKIVISICPPQPC
jgi:predicted lysophospholipase L1 biosynthesis ABC-type transport system permease subunit